MNIGMKVCLVCRMEKEEKKFEMKPSGRRNICEQCRNLRKKLSSWLGFLRHFNFICQCCGESDIRFLTVDHVQNDGYKDSPITTTVLRKAKEEGYPRDKYNLLCWNCNCGRAKNNGICPHNDIITKEQYYENLLTLHDIKLPMGGPRGLGSRGEYRHKYPGTKEERAKLAQIFFKMKNNPKLIDDFIKGMS